MSNRVRNSIIVLCLCLFAGMAGACGKKGPLYLPGQQQTK